MAKMGGILSMVLVALVAGCFSRNPRNCDDGVCSDPAFPFCDRDGAIGGEPRACIAAACTAGAAVACQGASSIACNASGSGFDVTPCENGCNTETFVCRACEPMTAACSGASVVRCGADGAVTSTESCTSGCVAAPSAHCAHLQPKYLPDVCDSPAVAASLVVSSSGTLDTGLDQTCNGGIVDQPGARALCVLRYGTISIAAGATLKLTGTRPVAFVSDGDIGIAGVLDVSGDHVPVGTSGPGGGSILSGSSALGTKAGGGAGFHTAGGAGGSPTVDGGGGIAGVAMSNPATLTALIGGPRSGDTLGGVNGGGGGGGVALISCRGGVSVTGTIDAGGGGGFGSPFSTVGGGGGGAGGYVVVQGMEVALTGAIYANGGGGGAGVGNAFQGSPGEDGLQSQTMGSPGGPPLGGGGGGGCGGWSTAPPCTGKAPTGTGTTAGGGGGSAGFIQFYLPMGHTPTIAPLGISPPLEPIAPIALR